MARPKDRPGGSTTGSGTTPPPPPPAPKPKEKTLSGGAAFNQFILAHQALKPYASLIWKWSREYGFSPVELAALIWRESVSAAVAQKKDPLTIMSPTGEGYGLAQINPKVWFGKTVFGEKITKEWAEKPGNALRFAAWYYGSFRSKHDADTSYFKYSHGPNAEMPASGPPFRLSSLFPKGFVPTATGLSPSEKASTAAELAAEKQKIGDPWVVINKNGTLGMSHELEPPKNAVFVGPKGLKRALTQSEFLNAYGTYNDISLQYTNKNAGPARVAAWIAKGYSPTTVANVLSKGPDFINSPVWKMVAPGIIGTAKKVFGNDWKPDREFVRRAIVEKWDGPTFEAKLRARPEYVKGPVFKNLEAEFTATYADIFGSVLPEDRTRIREAVAAGWTEAQFAQWLRSTENYQSSAEFQDRMTSFLGGLGLITGQQAVLRPGQVAATPNPSDVQTQPAADGRPQDVPPPNPDYNPIPNDPRISGKAEPVKKKNNLVAGLR